MRPIIIVLMAVALSGSFGTAGASWIAPQRPLSPEEWLEYDISGADAICLGTILAVHDTVMDIAQDGGGFPSRSLTIVVSRWLKGHDPERQLVLRVSPFDDEPMAGPSMTSAGHSVTSVAGTPRILAFMLRRLPNGWGICDGPGAGAHLLPRDDDGAFEKLIEQLIRKQSVDSLLHRADAVLVGTFNRIVRCEAGSRLRCAIVAVDSVLAGDVRSDSVRVFSTQTAGIASGPSLYVLERSSTAEFFEIIGFQSGSQSIASGRTSRWNLSLGDIAKRLASRRPVDRIEPRIDMK